MNICVKHTIDAFSNSQLADETLARLLVRFFPGVVQKAEYIDAVKNNPLDSGRDTVAQKTAPMFAHFGKIGMVRSSDISKKYDIIT